MVKRNKIYTPIILIPLLIFVFNSLFFTAENVVYSEAVQSSHQNLNNTYSPNLLKSNEEPTITISSPFHNKTIIIPEDIYNPYELKIYIPVYAHSEETIDSTITFVTCTETESCPDENSIFSNTVSIPGHEFINIAPYFNSNPNLLNIFIKGLINAIIDESGSVTFEDITTEDETISVQLNKVIPFTDNDKNGIPENITNLIESSYTWFSNQPKGESLRSVLIVPLNLDKEKLTLKLTENLQIDLPVYNLLLENGALSSENSIPFAIITLSKDYSALIDIVTDSITLAEWLTNISTTSPGLLMENLPLLSVFLLQLKSNGEVTPIYINNSNILINLIVSGTTENFTSPVGVFTYPARVLGQYLTNDASVPNIWSKISHDINEENLLVNIPGNSIVGIFKLLLRITSVSPSRIPVGAPTPLTLKGVIPVGENKTIEEAEELYEVRIDGIKAEFRNGGSNNENLAITSYTPDSENQMYVTSPVIPQPGTVDLEVIDKLVEGYSFILPDAIQVLNVYTVNTSIYRTDETLSPNAKITLNPPNSPELSQLNQFFNGDRVILSISDLDNNTFFVGWFDSEGNLLSNQQSLLLEVRNNINVIAKLTKNQTYTINISVEPPNSGTVMLEPSQEGYQPGTTVKLTAIPNLNYEFDKWLLPNAQTSEVNPLTIIVDHNYEITAVFKEKPTQIFSVLPFEHSEFIPDEEGKERLAVWVFGGVVCEINGQNLSEDMELQLINSKTREVLIPEVKPLGCSADRSKIKIAIPSYPNYVDEMPEFIDTDLKFDTQVIPAFRYYHYRTDINHITYTAFLADLSTAQKVTIHLESADKSGELDLPPLTDIQNTLGGGIIRSMVITNNPTPTASAIFFGNTLINGDIYGYPIVGMYEISVHLFQPSPLESNLSPGSPTYEPARNTNGRPLLLSPKYPYNLDGTPNSQIVPIKIKLPANDLDYNYFREGISVFGQFLNFDYISYQVIPEKFTSFQSQILSTDLDPLMTETIQGPAQNITMRTYSLNSFGIRMGSSLPFQTTSLIRLTSENGVLNSPVEGKTEATIVSPQGGLAYIDRIVIRNPQTGSQLSVSITKELGINEGFVKFKIPASQETGIMDLLLYSRGNPFSPTVTLPNVIVYSKPPERLDYLWLIPTGLVAIILGAVAEGTNGGGPCFIATAVYGTPLADEVNTLRTFRDQFLLTNLLGTAFVEFYYDVSPPIAEFVAQHPTVALLVRLILTPLIVASKVLLISPTLVKAITSFTILYYIIRKTLNYFHSPGY